MASSSPTRLSLGVIINKQKSKVLFAEADSYFINVLLSFLTMPLGKVARVLEKHNGEEASAIGSISSLYKGLSDLDITHFSMRDAKEMLLNPQSYFRAECRRLALDVSDSALHRYFLCQDENCWRSKVQNISLYSCIECDCGKLLNRPLDFGESSEARVFINSSSSFIITDDLCLTPMTGIIQTFNNLDATVIEGAEKKCVTFGLSEMKDLLQLCLTSTTPLTDMIIGKRQSSYTATKPELHNFQNKEANTRKISLQVFLQKSTNRFLFAVATDEFVDLLFSFLAIPVGGVDFLLGGNTGLKNIDNLYRSVSSAIDDKYFTTPDTKSRLINPKVAHGYISKNQLLPLSEEGPPKLRYTECHDLRVFFSKTSPTLLSKFKMIKELYVKKQTTFLITDDLKVTSHCLATSISIINGLGIPPSDVKEMELHIGVKEALDILKVSLTSETALTDALINPRLNSVVKAERIPKQER